jgi:hypothetical protein
MAIRKSSYCLTDPSLRVRQANHSNCSLNLSRAEAAFDPNIRNSTVK